MIKFFKVKKDNIIYKKYYNWLLSLPKLKENWEKFSKLTGIESTQFVAKFDLYIIPTENDLIKFEKYFCKDIYNQGLRKFKRNSPIQKDWERFAISNNMLIEKPNFVMDFIGKCFIGKSSSQLFDCDGELYASIEADFYSTSFPAGYEEIDGETFYHYYKIVEERLEKKNENT